MCCIRCTVSKIEISKNDFYRIILNKLYPNRYSERSIIFLPECPRVIEEVYENIG